MQRTMRVIPFEYTRMQEGMCDQFIVIIDDRDQAHLLRIDHDEVNDKFTTDTIPEFSMPEIERAELDDADIIELAIDWIGETFYYDEHDTLGDESSAPLRGSLARAAEWNQIYGTTPPDNIVFGNFDTLFLGNRVLMGSRAVKMLYMWYQ
jgi:hypothetical protein